MPSIHYNSGLKNDRGVALLIVLLVTALLIALIFEFAYGTRVSLRAAVNFRDSQRAYFLARSGVYVFARYKDALGRDLPSALNMKPGEWSPPIPGVSEGDRVLTMMWEDEAGKIRIPSVAISNYTKAMIDSLFRNKEIDRAVLDRMIERAAEIQKLGLLTELHQYMSDEEFNKVRDFLTVSPVVMDKININTASPDVLLSLGISPSTVGSIIEERNETPFSDHVVVQNYQGISGVKLEGLDVANFLTEAPSSIVKVFSSATVGGYTKSVEAIIDKSTLKIHYWRAL